MNRAKVTMYDSGNKVVMKMNKTSKNVPPLNQIQEIIIEDHDGTRYLFRKMEELPGGSEDRPDTPIDYETISSDLNNIKEIFITLTKDQRDIIMHIYFLYKNKIEIEITDDYGEIHQESPKIIIQGPAGCGKSTIINFIEKLITWEENKTSNTETVSPVLKCAFTGKAASNIQGSTLHSCFALPIYKSKRLSKNFSKKKLLEGCNMFICDEISMVGLGIMGKVNTRLQQVFDNKKLYGDRFVLLVGDLFQIDPVMDKCLYPNTIYWTSCDFYELTKIIRQQDERFISALNNFRDSKMTLADIQLLQSRQVQEEDVDEIPDSVIHLYYKNEDVDGYNDMKINESNEKEEIVKALADKEDWPPSELRVKIGIRYMIIYNVDVGDGLANGTTGIVKDFDYDINGDVDIIWMEFTSSDVGKKARREYLKANNRPFADQWVPIRRKKLLITPKHTSNVRQIICDMFPLRAAEAITVHKSQGQTYHDGVCIHLTDKLRTDKSLQYVALTRVKRVEDLYIVGNFDFSKVVNDYKFNRTQTELARLRTEKKLKLAYETFETDSDNVVIYLNTGSTFNEHYQFVSTDPWYSNASVLIFTETNTESTDEIEMPGFELAYRSEPEYRDGTGIMCYKKPNKLFEHIFETKDYESKAYLSLFRYERDTFVLIAVRGNMAIDFFEKLVRQMLSLHMPQGEKLLVVGDFKEESTSSSAVAIEFQMINMGYYVYMPSSNNPMYVKLPAF